MTTWVFPILTKKNYLLLMGEMLTSDSLSCKVQEISFEHRQKPDSIKSRRNYIEGFCGKIVKVISSKFEKATLSCNLVSIPWITEIYSFSKQQIIWAKRNNIIFIFFYLNVTPLISSKAKEGFSLWKIYSTLEWHDKITSWTAFEVESQIQKRWALISVETAASILSLPRKYYSEYSEYV